MTAFSTTCLLPLILLIFFFMIFCEFSHSFFLPLKHFCATALQCLEFELRHCYVMFMPSLKLHIFTSKTYIFIKNETTRFRTIHWRTGTWGSISRISNSGVWVISITEWESISSVDWTTWWWSTLLNKILRVSRGDMRRLTIFKSRAHHVGVRDLALKHAISYGLDAFWACILRKDAILSERDAHNLLVRLAWRAV